jgi:bifunctional DNase/RNase
LLREVAEAVQALPLAQREAALLVCFEGLSTGEAAAALGVSENAMKVRLHRARANLRVQFGVQEKKERRKSMVEIEVYDVALRHRQHEGQEVTNAVILLKEKHGARMLPIWVGLAEATALAVELQGMELPRPMTYNFAMSLLEAGNVRVRSGTVNRQAEGTYYASVEVEGGGKAAQVDARPSDAINLVLRAGAPLYVDDAVLQSSGLAVKAGEGDRAGARALLEFVQERMVLAGKALAECVKEEPREAWRDLGIEPA